MFCRLWFDELLAMWDSFHNNPSWEKVSMYNKWSGLRGVWITHKTTKLPSSITMWIKLVISDKFLFSCSHWIYHAFAKTFLVHLLRTFMCLAFSSVLDLPVRPTGSQQHRLHWLVTLGLKGRLLENLVDLKKYNLFPGIYAVLGYVIFFPLN